MSESSKSMAAIFAAFSIKAAEIASALGPDPMPAPSPRSKAAKSREAAHLAAREELHRLTVQFALDDIADAKRVDVSTRLVGQVPYVRLTVYGDEGNGGYSWEAILTCPFSEEDLVAGVNKAIEDRITQKRLEFEAAASKTRKRLL